MVKLTVRKLAGVLHQPLFRVRRQIEERGEVAGLGTDMRVLRDTATGYIEGVMLTDAEAGRLGVEAATSQPFASESAPKHSRVRTSQTDAGFEVVSEPEDVEPEEVETAPVSSQETGMVRKNASQPSQREHQGGSTAQGYFVLGGIVVLGLVMPALTSRGNY